MIIIPDLFTPYIEGREKAIDRNWNDIKNYNKEQKNQLSNLKDLATFSPEVNKKYDERDKTLYEAREAARTDQVNEALQPGRAAVARSLGGMTEANAGALAALRYIQQWLAGQGNIGMNRALARQAAANAAGGKTAAGGTSAQTPPGLPNLGRPDAGNNQAQPGAGQTTPGAGTQAQPGNPNGGQTTPGTQAQPTPSASSAPPVGQPAPAAGTPARPQAGTYDPNWGD